MTEHPTPRFRVLIVDDEPAARRGVAQLLAEDDAFEIVGECATGADMVAAVERHDPELVFLDIQMPGLDGFAALARLQAGTAPLVIFVTGYDRYAIKAFEAHAIDYVLKPYAPERFHRACAHAREQLRRRRVAEDATYGDRLVGLLQDLAGRTAEPRARGEPGRFLVKKPHGRAVLVSEDAVRWIEARKDYVRLHTEDGYHLMRETMNKLERQLEGTGFLRVHRSVIIRIDCVSELRTTGDGRLEVELIDGSRHPVSATGRRQLQQRLGYKV